MGSSSVSETYGNPCLAHSEDFGVKGVEVGAHVVLTQSCLDKPIDCNLERNIYPKTNQLNTHSSMQLWGFVNASKYEEVLESTRTEAPGICRSVGMYLP